MSKVCDICKQVITNEPGILADDGHYLHQRCYQRARNKTTAWTPLGCMVILFLPVILIVIGIVLGAVEQAWESRHQKHSPTIPMETIKPFDL